MGVGQEKEDGLDGEEIQGKAQRHKRTKFILVILSLSSSESIVYLEE